MFVSKAGKVAITGLNVWWQSKWAVVGRAPVNLSSPLLQATIMQHEYDVKYAAKRVEEWRRWMLIIIPSHTGREGNRIRAIHVRLSRSPWPKNRCADPWMRFYWKPKMAASPIRQQQLKQHVFTTLGRTPNHPDQRTTALTCHQSFFQALRVPKCVMWLHKGHSNNHTWA